MHPTIRLAVEYSILKSALEVACILDGSPASSGMNSDQIKNAIRYEIISEHGTCQCLSPIASLLSKLEARDLEDDGVHRELLRLAASEHVTDVVRACVFFDSVDKLQSSVAVEDVVFSGVDLTCIPESAEDLELMMAESDPDADDVPSDIERVVSDIKENGHLPVIPTEEELETCVHPTELQSIAKALMNRI